MLMMSSPKDRQMSFAIWSRLCRGLNSEKMKLAQTRVSCVLYFDKIWFWFNFCFTALQHILGHFERGQFP